MDTKHMQIKHQGWHNVELSGNLLTGDTFKVKEFIKRYLGGKWDSERKGWVVDPEQVEKYTTGGGETLMVR